MGIELDDATRQRLRRDLMEHRATHPVSDLEYVRRVLKISLNTFKRCIADTSGPLRVKRQTLRAIAGSLRLRTSDYPLPFVVPEPAALQGGYEREAFAFLVGRYVQYRRACDGGKNLSRSTVDLFSDEERGCLGFAEQTRRATPSGPAQTIAFRGEVFMHGERMLMSLLGIVEGEVRLTLLHTPKRRPGMPDADAIGMRGAQLAHGAPKGYVQPVVTPVLLEEARHSPGRGGPDGVVTPADPDFRRADRILADIEMGSVVMTPLLRRMSEPEIRGMEIRGMEIPGREILGPG